MPGKQPSSRHFWYRANRCSTWAKGENGSKREVCFATLSLRSLLWPGVAEKKVTLTIFFSQQRQARGG